VRIESLFTLLLCFLTSLSLTLLNAQQSNKEFTDLWGEYLGQPPPGFKPEPFVPEVFSVWGDYGFHLHTSVYFSPDNKELFFANQTMPVVAGRSCSIWRMQQIDGRWTKPAIASFSSDYSDRGGFYSSTGDTLYFSSTRPTNEKGSPKDIDIWYVKKNEGGWSRPQRLGYPVNTAYSDLGGAVTASGTMYLSSDRPGGKGRTDIYCTRFIIGDYSQVDNLGESVNTDADEYVIYVADDESYMIIRRIDLRDKAESGLYVSYKGASQEWTRAKSMGDHINAFKMIDASVSPDGHFLFLLSEGNCVYWLETSIIEYLRNENLEISNLLMRAMSEGNLSKALRTYENLKRKHSAYIEINEYLLNQRGHQLLDAEQYVKAIALFQIIIELFPGSWNAYDSLGEAYLAAGQAALAVRFYEKSLELNPRNENAVRMLEYLNTVLHH